MPNTHLAQKGLEGLLSNADKKVQGFESSKGDFVLQQDLRCSNVPQSDQIDSQCCGIQLGPSLGPGTSNCKKGHGPQRPDASCYELCLQAGRIGDDHLFYGCGGDYGFGSTYDIDWMIETSMRVLQFLIGTNTDANIAYHKKLHAGANRYTPSPRSWRTWLSGRGVSA